MAYLLIFCAYGTHLPGSGKGWVDGRHSVPGSPVRAHDPEREVYWRLRLNEIPFLLGEGARAGVTGHPDGMLSSWMDNTRRACPQYPRPRGTYWEYGTEKDAFRFESLRHPRAPIRSDRNTATPLLGGTWEHAVSLE
jgi:hypothetical protein